MSEREFDDYQNGEQMFNDTDHSKSGKHTDSVGFCFFPEEPDDAIRWLSGIVNDDVCVTFDVPEDKVRVSSGTYIDPDKSDESPIALLADICSYIMGDEMKHCEDKERTEYCCTEYDNKTFKLVDYKYSERVQIEKQFLAELERKPEELPEGVLLQGTVTKSNIIRAHYLINKALENTPLQGKTEAEVGIYGPCRITLPDGRFIYHHDSVEVHDDGIVLVNGKLYTDGFPRLTFNSGCFLCKSYCVLETHERTSLTIPESLFRKYEAAAKGEEFNS